MHSVSKIKRLPDVESLCHVQQQLHSAPDSAANGCRVRVVANARVPVPNRAERSMTKHLVARGTGTL